MMPSSDDATTRADTGPRAVVAGHGEFAAGIISAVQQIAGVGTVFRGLGNAGFDAAGLVAALRDAVVSHGASVVFTDLPAGSCTIAARRLTREVPGLAVVSGANLPMLLDFALSGDTGPATASRAAERGREGIAVLAAVAPDVKMGGGSAH